MILTPKYGWTTFTLNGFSCESSYLTDTPHNLLGCFISLLINGNGYCYFDGEGTDCELFISRDSVIVVSNKKRREVLDLTPERYSDSTIKAWAKELADDIKKDIDAWANWDTLNDGSKESVDEVKNNKEILQEQLGNILFLIEEGGSK